MDTQQLIAEVAQALGAGEFVVSRRHRARTRTISVATGGTRVKFGLPNLKGVAAWWLVILNESTAPSGTDTRLYFSINDERDKAAVRAALVAGNGLYCLPGQSFELDMAEDGEPAQSLEVDLQGVVVTAGPAYAAGAVKATIAAFPMMRAKRD